MPECDVLAISRAERFSPNSVEKDAAVLGSVCRRLTSAGLTVQTVSETDAMMPAKGYISMGRLPQTLDFLDARQREGKPVVNSAAGVRLCCNRRLLNERMQAAGVALPPVEGAKGYWLKRADGTAEGREDVQFAETYAEMLARREKMMARGIKDVVIQAHVEGDLLKFYGVSGQDFFRAYYPNDDGQWKFGDERRNGRACHYHFSMEHLRQMAENAAKAAGVVVYGGDCIVDADGNAVIIDFNDWPSFSRCREEAADAIALHLINIYKNIQGEC